MKTKTWIFIFALILIVCLGASFFFLAPGEASTQAEITSHGQLVKTVDLHIDQEFTVDTDHGGHNVVTVKDSKIAVTEANCPDHYCMDRGFCAGGAQIVCLPNRLVLRFVEKQEIDGMTG